MFFSSVHLFLDPLGLPPLFFFGGVDESSDERTGSDEADSPDS
jgi:hypothetical protein